MQLDHALFKRAKHEAARRGETLAALIEQGLQLLLAQSRPRVPRRRVVLPTCRAGGGVLPDVDLNDSATLLDIMEHRW